MDNFVKAFIKGSVVWLALGALLGLAMALDPGLALYRPAHLHMLTLGFVAMMIFGVGYHVIPRMAGFPLVSNELPFIHCWIANFGLALMVGGFVLRVHFPGAGAVLLGIGAFFSALGALTFAYLIWRTLDGPDSLRKIAQRRQTGGGHLPILKLVPHETRGAETTARRGPSHKAGPR
jgi:cbb3-type cytochrome oxidase subunit 1